MLCASDEPMSQLSSLTRHGSEQFHLIKKYRELVRAMSFGDEDAEYEFSGTSAEVTRQIGNAVPVRLACALVTSQLQGEAVRASDNPHTSRAQGKQLAA